MVILAICRSPDPITPGTWDALARLTGRSKNTLRHHVLELRKEHKMPTARAVRAAKRAQEAEKEKRWWWPF